MVQTGGSRKIAFVVISREFGINIKDMKVEAKKLTAQDRAELASAIAPERCTRRGMRLGDM
ncbi:MAG: hypothetical protein WAN65_06170, partial [Candidatus Sulfotelmatobacter sp.]